ncbi:NAD-binding protein [Qipengyuania profunda]|uniref:NAD-binding protein n=1 Tax=Qipengyuania profunda TaxID=3113984 RepID=UPI002ED6B23A
MRGAGRPRGRCDRRGQPDHHRRARAGRRDCRPDARCLGPPRHGDRLQQRASRGPEEVRVSTYYGDATRPDLLASAGIERARILVVALDEREQIDKLVRYACANFPQLHVVSRAKDRDHVYHLWAMGCRDIVRETYDSSLRMGRSVYEALGFDRQSAIAMVEAFETMDRTSMREVADTYRLDIPAYENEELLAKIRELKAEWDPKLREAMDEIAARGR